MKKKIFTSITFLLVSVITFQASFAMSIPLPLTDGDQTNDTCLTLQTPLLRYQSRDVDTNGEVSALQDFLISKGLLSGSPTGFYGRLTVSAVKSYQQSKGVISTGSVGPLTKSVIQNETCVNAGSNSLCSLDTEYFSSGYMLPGQTSSGCVCPTNSARVRTNPGFFKCTEETVSVCAVEKLYSVPVIPNPTRCSCPPNTTEVNMTNPSEGLRVSKFKCVTSFPKVCTMEMRICPDGTAMPRDPDCRWRVDKCANI
jgi:hypothetical protein